jgi:hypothetical protein
MNNSNSEEIILKQSEVETNDFFLLWSNLKDEFEMSFIFEKKKGLMRRVLKKLAPRPNLPSASRTDVLAVATAGVIVRRQSLW